jgi:excisionase family DNA binding protein
MLKIDSVIGPREDKKMNIGMNPLLAAFAAAAAPPKGPERFLSVDQYARAVGCRSATVRRDIKMGRIPFVGFGPRRIRIPASFLEKAAEQAWARYAEHPGQKKP